MSVVWGIVISVADSVATLIARLIDRRKGDRIDDPR